MDVTRKQISRILELTEMFLSFQTGFNLVNAAVVCAIQVSVFFSPVVCLQEQHHVVTRMSLRLSALIHLTSQSLWLSQSNALPTLPVQHVSVLASPPLIPDDKNTISWLTETNL